VSFCDYIAAFGGIQPPNRCPESGRSHTFCLSFNANTAKLCATVHRSIHGHHLFSATLVAHLVGGFRMSCPNAMGGTQLKKSRVMCEQANSATRAKHRTQPQREASASRSLTFVPLHEQTFTSTTSRPLVTSSYPHCIVNGRLAPDKSSLQSHYANRILRRGNSWKSVSIKWIHNPSEECIFILWPSSCYAYRSLQVQRLVAFVLGSIPHNRHLAMTIGPSGTWMDTGAVSMKLRRREEANTYL
jgi:hypothetical protein